MNTDRNYSGENSVYIVQLTQMTGVRHIISKPRNKHPEERQGGLETHGCVTPRKKLRNNLEWPCKDNTESCTLLSPMI